MSCDCGRLKYSMWAGAGQVFDSRGLADIIRPVLGVWSPKRPHKFLGVQNRMPNQIKRWLICTGLLAVGILVIGGSTSAAELAQPRDAGSPVYLEQISASIGSVNTQHALSALSSAGMGDLVSETFESDFPSGWWVYDAISQSTGLDYYWGSTVYTRAEGTHSGSAVRGGLDGASLTDTATYAAAVDAWMVYGPVSLHGAQEARLDFVYLKPSASGALTVAVATDFDPIRLTGTFTGVMLGPATGWTTGTLPLSSYVGKDVYVAFRYRTPSGGNAANGPFVDDIHLRANYRLWMPVASDWQLQISKTLSAGVVWPGQPFVYSITVNNRGMADATGVVISDVVPVSMTFVSADSGYSFANQELSWHGLTVPAGGSIVRHVTLAVPAGASLGTVALDKYSVSVPPNPVVFYGPYVSVAVPFTYLDDFSNPASGWPIQYYDDSLSHCPPPGPWYANYLPGGGYGVGVGCAWNGIIVPAPVRIADASTFTLEVDLRSRQDFMWYSSYGVFFNGSEDLRQVYIVRLFQGQDPPEYAVYRWPNFQGSSDDQPPPERLTYDTCWLCTGLDYAWNHMLVRRHGPTFEVWMGAGKGIQNLVRYFVITESDTSFVNSNHVRVGVHQGNFEWRFPGNNASYEFDNFGLSPAVR